MADCANCAPCHSHDVFLYSFDRNFINTYGRRSPRRARCPWTIASGHRGGLRHGLGLRQQRERGECRQEKNAWLVLRYRRRAYRVRVAVHGPDEPTQCGSPDTRGEGSPNIPLACGTPDEEMVIRPAKVTVSAPLIQLRWPLKRPLPVSSPAADTVPVEIVPGAVLPVMAPLATVNPSVLLSRWPWSTLLQLPA